ncbi:DMT family transporter [Aquipuribacter sp. MA13-6]|uniref:DMT family transporter n=1 Tax=unclassified Aquipuribacter TaxID=2635084 RepID=UPI003EE8EB8C
MNPTLAGTLRITALALLWGSSFLWIDLALDGLSPVQITVARLMLGAGLLAMVARHDVATVLARRDVYVPLFIAALLANAVPFTLFAVAQQTIPSNLAGALNATTPIWSLVVALGARTQKRTGIVQVGGLLLGLTGTTIILSPGGSDVPLFGALMALLAAASYGAGYVFIAARLTPTGLPNSGMAATQLITAALLMSITVPLAGLTPVALSPQVALAVLVLGIGGTGLAYLLLYRIIADDGPVAASTVTYLLPVVAIILGAVVLQEPLTPTLLIGSGLVLAGVALARRGNAAPRPS